MRTRGHYPGIEQDAALVRRLAQEHLGPLPVIDADTEARALALIAGITRDTSDPKTWFCLHRCCVLLAEAGLTVNRRQVKVWYDAEFDRRAAADAAQMRAGFERFAREREEAGR